MEEVAPLVLRPREPLMRIRLEVARVTVEALEEMGVEVDMEADLLHLVP